MTDAPKLLTEADARRLAYSPNPQSTLAELRERGLIAPEPVDPLLIEAREIVSRVNRAHNAYRQWSQEVANGEHDDHVEVRSALAALKRGMEMRPPPLTREMVDRAFASLPTGTVDYGVIHAALVKQMEQN